MAKSEIYAGSGLFFIRVVRTGMGMGDLLYFCFRWFIRSKFGSALVSYSRRSDC